MAEKSSFFTSLNGDRKYKASDFAEYFSTFIGNGVFPNPSSNLLVTSNGDMTINLSPGFAWINGYMYNNTDNLTLTVKHSDSALNRIDSVVIRCDFVNREIKAYVKEGMFATAPVPPSLNRGVDAYELSIAEILIESGAISIQQSKITDTRLNSEVCGIVAQTVETIDTTELYRKLQGYIEERGKDVESWIGKATETWEIDFNTWFNSIKDVLNEDIAGNLANRILELENKVNNLDLVASKVTMSDGTTVEETVTKNKTDILGNTDLANQALAKANEAFLRGDNVKTQLVDKLISKGLNVSTDNTFEELINNISSIGELKTAYGNVTVSSGNYVSMTITGLNFTPFIVITCTNAVYGTTNLYDATLCIGQICDDYPSSLIYTLGNSNKYSDSYVNGKTYYMKYGGFKAPIYKSMGVITNGAWFAIGI